MYFSVFKVLKHTALCVHFNEINQRKWLSSARLKLGPVKLWFQLFSQRKGEINLSSRPKRRAQHHWLGLRSIVHVHVEAQFYWYFVSLLKLFTQ